MRYRKKTRFSRRPTRRSFKRRGSAGRRSTRALRIGYRM